MTTVVEGGADRAEMDRQLARLGAFFADTRPDPAMLEEYRAMIREERWDAIGLAVAATDCIRTLRFYPRPAELRMAYQLWAMGRATAERMGVGPQHAALPPPWEGEAGSGSERVDVLRAILREHLHAFTRRGPLEQAEYARERAHLRAECEASGEVYFTGVEERMREAGVWAPEAELRDRLAAAGRQPTHRCRDCRDAGWLRDLSRAVGSVARLVRCGCRA